MPADLVDSDITKAQTLPSEFYCDNQIFQNVKKVFNSSWLFAAHNNELADCNVFPLNQMTDLGEAMMITKGSNTEDIRCISNVCTHRGMIIENSPCKTNTLQCPYHGRTFSLDGKIKSMPEFDDVHDFPSAEDNLREYSIREWNGLQFIRMEEESLDFDEVFSHLENRIGWMGVKDFTYDDSRDRDYTISANWALYVDNYLEGFHIPFVHSDLNQSLDYSSYQTEIFTGGVLQVGIAKEGEPSFELPETSVDYGKKIGAYYYWLFPNTMLNFYPWGLSVNTVIPIDVDKTRIIYRGFVSNPELLGKGAGGDLDKVELEDQEIVESVQKGVASSAYQRGRYSPKMEIGVHHFHRMLMHYGN